MQKRHQDRKQYFDEQSATTQKYVIPYISASVSITQDTRVLEIGCGEGGNMLPFLQMGCDTVGVDLHEGRIKQAEAYLKHHIDQSLHNRLRLIYEDIYNLTTDDIGEFDVVIMRDVIEHIHDQKRFLGFLQSFVKKDGVVFFGFPPWRMPFGGHQQTCKHSLLSKLPFFHLLPLGLYPLVLRICGETQNNIDSLLEIRQTGLSIHRFEKIAKDLHLRFVRKDLYFINPNYEAKFKLRPRRLHSLLAQLPYFKDFFTTCYYCVVSYN